LTARRLFEDPANDVYMSVASAWEIIVKHNLGKLPLPELPHDFIKNNRIRHRIETLPLDEAAVLQLSRLPEYHKDPFDRIIICQAIAGGMTILTPDSHISSYPVRVEW
jgi:PIN domain nuclease of toxin-antitoxin system